MDKDEAPHPFVGSRITFNLLYSKGCRCWSRLARRISGIAGDLVHQSNGHGVRRDLRIGCLQGIYRNTEFQRDTADRVTRLDGVGKRRGARKRRLRGDQALGSLRRTLGGGSEWDQVTWLRLGGSRLSGAGSQ